jgi:hypothetical protein
MSWLLTEKACWSLPNQPATADLSFSFSSSIHFYLLFSHAVFQILQDSSTAQTPEVSHDILQVSTHPNVSCTSHPLCVHHLHGSFCWDNFPLLFIEGNLTSLNLVAMISSSKEVKLPTIVST